MLGQLKPALMPVPSASKPVTVALPELPVWSKPLVFFLRYLDLKFFTILPGFGIFYDNVFYDTFEFSIIL